MEVCKCTAPDRICKLYCLLFPHIRLVHGKMVTSNFLFERICFCPVTLKNYTKLQFIKIITNLNPEDMRKQQRMKNQQMGRRFCQIVLFCRRGRVPLNILETLFKNRNIIFLYNMYNVARSVSPSKYMK
jgi:hypothetical protein